MTQLTYQGLPCCACQLEWLTAFNAELAARGMKQLEIAQLIGNAPASAGRHLGGGNIDWWTVDVATARLARRFGGLAMLRDGTRDSFDNNKHTHCYLFGCPHMSDGARRDMAEVLTGGDGLIGSVPDDPRLTGAWKGVTWQNGVKEMKSEAARRARTKRFGTHNLLDGKGRATEFADIMFFTEAPSVAEVSQELGHGWIVRKCSSQKDLVVAYRRDAGIKLRRAHYVPAHPGRSLVTPARGTWKLEFEIVGVDVDVVFDHRINAAFPPFIRGEKIFRIAMWKLHTGISKAMARRSKKKGRIVVGVGDPNVVADHQAWGKVLPFEHRHNKDVIASNRPLIDKEVGAKDGSDHNKIWASIKL